MADDRVAREETELLAKLVDLTHEHDLSLPTRTIFMSSESTETDGSESGVDSKMAERVLKNIHVLETLSTDPITIVMNNIGGDMYHGLAIYDAIVMSPCLTRIVVRGHAMSMGSIILQAANVRIMGANAVQLVHYGSMGADGHAKTFQKWAAEARRTDAWMEDLYLGRIRERHPDFKLKRLQAMLDHDTFLTAEASIALGLADEVG